MGEELQRKAVQEIARSCDGEIPENFIHKKGIPQSKVESVPWMDDLVIDFSLLFAPSSSPESQLQLEKLRLALTQWGCFQGINHGLTSTFVDKVREVTKQFFALPQDEKQKYSRTIDDWNGYGNDTVVYDHQVLDWTDRLYLTLYPEDKRKLKYWPKEPVVFREVIDEYARKLRMMFEPLLKAMARCLDFEEDCFLKENGDVVNMDGRFNYYPPCPSPENVIGVKPHADGTALTILLQDKDVEGLQVLKEDRWFRVPIHPDAVFINVGDIIEIISNGLLKSPVHRVVTNSERERISLAVFCFPDLERDIGPVAGLITSDRPRMYKTVNHYDKIFFKYYQLGQRPLDDCKM